MSCIVLKPCKFILMLPLKQCCLKLSTYKILSISNIFLENQKNQYQQQKRKEKPREKPLRGVIASEAIAVHRECVHSGMLCTAESRSSLFSLIAKTSVVLTGTHTDELLGHVQSRRHYKKNYFYIHLVKLYNTTTYFTLELENRGDCR